MDEEKLSAKTVLNGIVIFWQDKKDGGTRM